MIIAPLLLVLLLEAATCDEVHSVQRTFPNRNDRQRHIVRFLNSPLKSFQGMMEHDRSAGIEKTVKVLFWNDASDVSVFGKDWLDVLHTTDCPVRCAVTMRRRDFEDCHVVVYNDLADKRSYHDMAPWQRSVLLTLSPVMFFVEQELQRADAIASFGLGNFGVDWSHFALMLGNSSTPWRGNFLENDVQSVWRQNGVFRRIIDPDQRKPRVGVFLEDCVSFEGDKARQFVLDLKHVHGVPMDLHGSCFERDGSLTKLPRRNQPQQLIDLMQQYPMILVVENARIDDYVTEGVYEALAAGSIPLYLGAPNIKHIIDPVAFVDLGQFGDNAQVAAVIKDLLARREYSDFEQWKLQQIVPFNTQNMLFKRGPNSLPCQLCQWYFNNDQHGHIVP